MESKTKHRILGILVIAGLIVILLPFFQRGKDISSETAMIQPPPFPDQSMQRSLNVNEPVNPTERAPAQASTQEKSQPLPIIQKTAEDIVREQPDDTIDTSQATSQMLSPIIETPVIGAMNSDDAPSNEATKKIETAENKTAANPLQAVESKTSEVESDASVNAPEATVDAKSTTAVPTKIGKTAGAEPDPLVKTPETASPAKKETASKKLAPKKSTHASKEQIKKKLVAHAKPKLAHRGSYLHLPIDNNGLANINSSVWVIQVGSYRNKANALRVVNKLRAKGYRAFIQQVSTTFGKNTRVFVGPENKQSSAHALADELESNMHLRGIVISYKPLAS